MEPSHNNLQFANELKIEVTNTDNKFIYGFVEDKEKLLENLFRMGYSFSVRRSQKLKSTFLTKCSKGKGDIEIDMGCIFRKDEFIVYNCAHGPKYYRKHKQEDHPSIGTNTRRKRDSKKMNCEAILKMVTVTYYPNYKITANCSWRTKTKIIQKLKEGHEEKRTRFYLALSGPAVHNHDTTTTYLHQPTRDEVKRIIKDEVDKGVTNKHILKVCIEASSATSNVPPISRGFFPDNKTIYNYILKYSNKKKENKTEPELVDQEPSKHNDCDEVRIKDSNIENTYIEDIIVETVDIVDIETECEEEISKMQTVLNSIHNITYSIGPYANVENLRRIKKRLQEIESRLKKEIRNDALNDIKRKQLSPKVPNLSCKKLKIDECIEISDVSQMN